jgi:hypothetical protein
MVPMSEPIVFISINLIKEGKLEALMEFIAETTPLIEADKPDTVFFQAYMNQEGTEVTFIHVFPDADAMDRHVVGSNERSSKAYEYMEPQQFEIYGRASAPVMSTMAERAGHGIALIVKTEGMGGFIRLQFFVSDER